MRLIFYRLEVTMSDDTTTHGLDDLDLAILRVLQADADTSVAELARSLNLSPPATHQRVRRLKRRGYVRQTVALLDHTLLGHDLMCFVHINMLAHHRDRLDVFSAAVRDLPEVLECHHVTGEHDFLLKVISSNRKGLERLLVEKLSVIPGVGRIQTSVVLSEVKATTAIPLE